MPLPLFRLTISYGATDKWAPCRKARRDVSKSWTGNRRRHNTRKIAIGGTRLDSRLSDFRSATKSAENHECALNGSVSVFVDLRLHLHVVPPTLSPSPPPPTPLLLPREGKHGDERVYSCSHCPLFTPSFCTLYVYYIRWRAPPFFVSHKGRTMTAARCVRSLMFYPSVRLPSTSFGDPRGLAAIPSFRAFLTFLLHPFFSYTI